MSSVEPTSDVWEHGLLPLPGAKLSEASLLALLELQHRLPADLSVGLEQWAALAAEGLSMRREQAAACMRLCYVLSPSLQTPTQPTRKLPADEAMRVPLGSLLLLLWVQVAQRELGPDFVIITASNPTQAGNYKALLTARVQAVRLGSLDLPPPPPQKHNAFPVRCAGPVPAVCRLPRVLRPARRARRLRWRHAPQQKHGTAQCQYRGLP